MEDPELEITLDEMIRTNDVIRDGAEDQDAIYLPPYYLSESGCAKRMSEATGMEAKTIHRLLEYKPPEG